MDEKVTFREIRRYASIGGIILAAVSTAYFLFDVNFRGATWMNILKLLINAAKIVACIVLMKYFMVRFRNDHEGVTKQDIKKLGTLTAFLSALIFATMTMAFLRFNQDFITEFMDNYVQANRNILDANGYAAIEKIEGVFPTVAFFSQLIYCFLFGWVLSAILAPRVVSDNPFINDSEDNSQETESEE